MGRHEKALVLRAKRGDKDAFSKLYTMYAQKIFRFIYFLLRDHDISEDLTQETFLRGWRSLSSFSQERGTFQAYLFAIARNLVTDIRRKKPTVSLSEFNEPAVFDNIEEELMRSGRKERVLKVIERLDLFDRQIIVLRFFEEMRFSQIAKITGANEGAVRVRLHRVLKSLKVYLEGKV